MGTATATFTNFFSSLYSCDEILLRNTIYPNHYIVTSYGSPSELLEGVFDSFHKNMYGVPLQIEEIMFWKEIYFGFYYQLYSTAILDIKQVHYMFYLQKWPTICE